MVSNNTVFGSPSTFRPRSSGLVPNTNKHAVEANPVWMTDSTYDNMNFNQVDEAGKRFLYCFNHI